MGECPEVIPSIKELIKMVRAVAVTSNCTEEILERHKLMGAMEIRRILLAFGLEEGWKRVKKLFSQPVQCMMRLERDLTDDEMVVLKEALGYEFDRRGYPIDRSSDDSVGSLDGGGGRGLPEGKR